MVQVGAVGRFSKYGNVQNAYKADGNREQELFIESSSFALSAGAGIIAAGVGSKALILLTIATPVGWVGLIVVVATATLISNDLVKDNSGSWYDGIMKWVGFW